MRSIRPLLIWLTIPAVSCLFGAAIRAEEPNPPDIQVDARGPVHEAYAQPWQANPAPNKAVDKKPPDPVPEEPATEKPAGKNVQWMPGYWQWDLDRKDFIWVSGFWRDVPEGRRWVMGYWAQTDEGYRWVSGHFAAAQEKDTQYVPQPPQNADGGPPAQEAPDDSAYIPGCWFYGEDGYSYRDGYWTESQADRVWTPASYYWTPYGYGFSSGYWDYPLAGRGLLFAPVYFNRPLWDDPGWFYRPSFAIGFGGLYDNFFVGFGYSHYFFGDYYGRGYLGFGIYPWFWNSSRFYDPLWAHDRWMNRGNPGWGNGFRNNYLGRVNGTMGLPPRTLAGQANATGGAGNGSQRMVNSLAQVRQSGQKLETVSPQQHAAHVQASHQMVSQAQHLSQGAPRAMMSNSGANYGGFSGGNSQHFSQGYQGSSMSNSHGSYSMPGSSYHGGYSSPGSFHSGGSYGGGGYHGGGGGFGGGGFGGGGGGHGGGGGGGGGGHGGGGGGHR